MNYYYPFIKVLERFKTCCNSIDYRCAIYKKKGIWYHAISVLRFSNKSIREIEKIYQELEKNLVIKRTENFKIICKAFDINEWGEIKEKISKKNLTISDKLDEEIKFEETVIFNDSICRFNESNINLKKEEESNYIGGIISHNINGFHENLRNCDNEIRKTLKFDSAYEMIKDWLKIEYYENGNNSYIFLYLPIHVKIKDLKFDEKEEEIRFRIEFHENLIDLNGNIKLRCYNSNLRESKENISFSIEKSESKILRDKFLKNEIKKKPSQVFEKCKLSIYLSFPPLDEPFLFIDQLDIENIQEENLEIEKGVKMINPNRAWTNFLRILHLSDIQEGQFGVKSDLQNKFPDEWQKKYGIILDDLKFKLNSIHNQNPIDVIIISGDLASMGLEEEYKQLSKEFITLIEEIFHNIPKDNWLVVPGNHDVHWDEGDKRFDEFIKFCSDNKFNPQFKLGSPESIFHSKNYKSKIEIILLNSCINILNKKTSKEANIPKDYFFKIEKQLNANTPKILVCHHRLHEISSRNHALAELRKKNVVLALSGDIHESRPTVDKIYDINCISAGSLMAKGSERELEIDTIPRQFNIYDIDFTTGILNLTTFFKIREWEEVQRDPIQLFDFKPDIQIKMGELGKKKNLEFYENKDKGRKWDLPKGWANISLISSPLIYLDNRIPFKTKEFIAFVDQILPDNIMELPDRPVTLKHDTYRIEYKYPPISGEKYIPSYFLEIHPPGYVHLSYDFLITLEELTSFIKKNINRLISLNEMEKILKYFLKFIKELYEKYLVPEFQLYLTLSGIEGCRLGVTDNGQVISFGKSRFTDPYEGLSLFIEPHILETSQIESDIKSIIDDFLNEIKRKFGLFDFQ